MMKRRSFLRVLCGLLGVGAVPALLAKPIPEADVRDDPALRYKVTERHVVHVDTINGIIGRECGERIWLGDIVMVVDTRWRRWDGKGVAIGCALASAVKGGWLEVATDAGMRIPVEAKPWPKQWGDPERLL